MTLLVTAIKVPGHELVAVKWLSQSLLSLWPSYLAFLTSFVTILVAWVHHHWVFTLIGKVDHPFLYWNGLLLLCVTFVPFPTAMLSEYLLNPEAGVVAHTIAALREGETTDGADNDHLSRPDDGCSVTHRPTACRTGIIVSGRSRRTWGASAMRPERLR